MRNQSVPIRERYFDANSPAEDRQFERRLLNLLLVQDGSTTLLCEAMAGQVPQLQVIHQNVTQEVPEVVRLTLRSSSFIARTASLVARGQVMSDNLSFVALDGLAPQLERELLEGRRPIGHLLRSLWVRRIPVLAGVEKLQERLWEEIGLPDARATRTYCICTSEGPMMLITETFRRGMLMSPSVDSPRSAAKVTG